MARIREKTLKFPGLNNTYTFADEADLFDANVDCTVGEYRIYNGDLYRCTTAHTGAWNASHFTAVKMGNEVSGLKAAITQVGEEIFQYIDTPEFTKGFYINSSGAVATASGYRCADIAFVEAKNGDSVSIDSGYYFNIAIYSSASESAFQTYRTFSGDRYDITGSCYIRCSIKKSDESDFNVADAKNAIHFNVYGDSTIEELETEVNNINGLFEESVGRNLLDTSKNVSGYLNSNGTIHANSSETDWVTTDYIDVSNIETIVASRASNGARVDLGCYFWLNFDSSKAKVGSQINSNATPYNIPDGVSYIRFSYHLNDVVNPMVQSGSARTHYEQYVLYTLFKNSDYSRKSESLPNKINGLTWCVFGDSLTEKNSKASTAYYDYIADDLSLGIYNMGVSGTGYARGDTNSFVTRMANIESAKYDFLTIFGSINDAGSGLEIGTPTDTGNSTICACINGTIDNFYAKTPFKPIGLITPCPWATVPPNSEWGNNYADAIIAIGKLRGIPVLDLFRCSGIRPWAGDAYIAEYYTENGVADEGTHPNSKGHKMFLYPHIKQFVLELIQGLPT